MNRLKAGDTLDDFRPCARGQEHQHVSSHVVLQHAQNDGDHLGVLAADHVGDRARIHPLQDLQSSAALPRQDTAQHRCGFVLTQRALEHLLHVVGGTQTQTRLLFERHDEFVEHEVDSLLRQIGHRYHRRAQGLNFLRVHEA